MNYIGICGELYKLVCCFLSKGVKTLILLLLCYFSILRLFITTSMIIFGYSNFIEILKEICLNTLQFSLSQLPFYNQELIKSKTDFSKYIHLSIEIIQLETQSGTLYYRVIKV